MKMVKRRIKHSVKLLTSVLVSASILSGYVKVKNEMLAEQAESLLSEAEDLSQADEGSPEKSD